MDKTIAKFKVEKAKRKVAETTKNIVSGAVKFANDNPVVAVALVGVAGKVIVSSINGHNKRKAASIQSAMELQKALEVWDPVCHVHYIMKRPMSGSEAIKFSELMANGMTRLEALKILNLV